MNLNDVRVFAAVVRHGGLAAAARATGSPKSTLSKRLGALEDELGVKLVHRGPRQFVVTDIGRDFFKHAEGMLIEADAAREVIAGRMAEPSGPVRITASVPMAQWTLAPILPALARRYPRIELVVDATDRFVDIVAEGYDIALRTHFAPLPDSDLVQRRLGAQHFILAAAPSYLERGAPLTPHDLAGHDRIGSSSAANQWLLRNAEGQVVRVDSPVRFTANETMLLLTAAVDGLGIVVLPEAFCADALAAGKLVRVLPEWTGGELTTSILTPSRRGQLPSVRAVVDFLVEHARE